MADPLSISASVLTVVIAAIQSARSLTETVKRFRDRDKTLRRLHDGLTDLINILTQLEEACQSKESTLALLEGPVGRCSQLCHEFENAMKEFSGKSKTGLRDWARMEFMRGDINEFMDTLAGYKSTISVALGTITMHTSRLSYQVLEEYNEMIKDTAYNLTVHLQRISEKRELSTTESQTTSSPSIDLNDEWAVTQQCLRICEDARSYIETLTAREPSLQPETAPESDTDCHSHFEAQRLTLEALDEHRDKYAELIGRLRARLESAALDETSRGDDEKARLQEEIDNCRKCLEVCKMAAKEVSRRKIHTVGEVIADGDSDQVVVTTLADLFDVKKATSTGNSAQLIGSMSDDALLQLSKDRYNSRFGALDARMDVGIPQTTLEPQGAGISGLPHRVGSDGQLRPTALQRKPTSNEVRKRSVEG